MRNIGRRNRYATIKSRVTGRDAAGQPSTSWQTLRSEWASVIAPRPSAAERMPADRTTAQGFYTVEIHYCTDVTIDMRLDIEGDTYAIVDVVPDVAGQNYTQLMCVRGVV